MTELEQKLRDLLAQWEVNDSDVWLAVLLLEKAYDCGIERGRELEGNYWNP